MIAEFLSYGFVQRGLVAGTLVAASCALLGVIGAYEAISKKYAFIGWMGAIAPWLILSF